MSAPTVELVSRDANARQTIRKWLLDWGRDVQVVPVSPAEAGIAALPADVSLVIVDATGSLGPGAGDRQRALDTVEAVRAQAPDVPILVTILQQPAGASTWIAEFLARSLEVGATDYLVGPARDTLLQHRVRLLLPDENAARDIPEIAPIRDSSAVSAPLQDLHNPSTGRLDAARIARFLAIPLKGLAAAVGVKYTSMQKTADAPNLQRALRPFHRVLALLFSALEDPAAVRAWLNTPRPDLEDASPLEVMRAGEIGAVLALLEGARVGAGA